MKHYSCARLALARGDQTLETHTIISPGSWIGIIGDGQLGRMMTFAAHRLGYRVVIFGLAEDSPAAQVADKIIVIPDRNWLDELSINLFCERADVVTTEWENPPCELLRQIQQRGVPTHPNADVLEVAQSRTREKETVRRLRIPTAVTAKIGDLTELRKAAGPFQFPGILKTDAGGYDGKGQRRVNTQRELESAWEALESVPCILERVVNFECEISIIVARTQRGEMRAFPVTENEHRDNILFQSECPGPHVTSEIKKQACEHALRITEHLDVVGLLAVEMFVTKKGDVLVNELAPRPHNSGHWTIDACTTDQFEQHIRAVCGLPLGSPDAHSGAVMRNLLGDEWRNWQDILEDPRARLHLYGKQETRPGRKMGHVTYLCQQQS